jgi:hypothetical protein
MGIVCKLLEENGLSVEPEPGRGYLTIHHATDRLKSVTLDSQTLKTITMAKDYNYHIRNLLSHTLDFAGVDWGKPVRELGRNQQHAVTLGDLFEKYPNKLVQRFMLIATNGESQITNLYSRINRLIRECD